MKNASPLLVFSIAVLSYSIQAQTILDTLILQESITLSQRAVDVKMDKVGQLYLITPANDLIKYNSDGVEQFRHSDVRRGRLHSINVNNPLEILLFYKDFGTVLFLDRTLNPTAQINLVDLGYTLVSAIALANDGNLWIYDDINAELLKINRKGEKLFRSGPLVQQIGKRLNAKKLWEYGNFVFLIEQDEQESSLILFDLFAQWASMHPLGDGIRGIQAFEGNILWQKDKTINVYNPKFRAEATYFLIGLPETEGEVYLTSNRVVWFGKKKDTKIFGYDKREK